MGVPKLEQTVRVSNASEPGQAIQATQPIEQPQSSAQDEPCRKASDLSSNSGSFSPVVASTCKADGDAFMRDVSKFAGKDSREPLFIEACVGCGVLSSVVKQWGIQVIPIDSPRDRHVPRCELVVMDLTSEFADDLLRKLVQDYNVIGVHIALPCGTCSKARGIPMEDGLPGPQPLRSFQRFHGLPNLEFLESRGIPWTVENPSNSWLWELPEMSFAIAHLHPCAYGGERKKNTAFRRSLDEFAALKNSARMTTLTSRGAMQVVSVLISALRRFTPKIELVKSLRAMLPLLSHVISWKTFIAWVFLLYAGPVSI